MAVLTNPSIWILKKLELVSGRNLTAIDIACGTGRHSFALAARQFLVTAVDRNIDLMPIFEETKVKFRCLDLEGDTWPLKDQSFDLALVSNYLYRPYLENIVELLNPGGYLIYETYGVGNEAFGKPKNPNFLIKPNELYSLFSNRLNVVENNFIETDNPKAIRAQFFARRASTT